MRVHGSDRISTDALQCHVGTLVKSKADTSETSDEVAGGVFLRGPSGKTYANYDSENQPRHLPLSIRTATSG